MPEESRQSGRHKNVLQRLVKSPAWGEEDLDAALREVTEAAAHTLGIERVNIWLYDESRSRITCIEHYERTSGEHASGTVLEAKDYPIYFKALDEERTIVAHDAHNDPRTAEFSGTYLDTHGITSLLDAPLHKGGEVIGIVCHEHVGPAREWTDEEQRFAASLADLASLAIESSERRIAQDALRRSEARTRAVLDHALVAVIITDERGAVTDWNPRAEVTFGQPRAEVLGKSLGDLILNEQDRAELTESLRQFREIGSGPMLGRPVELVVTDADGREFPAELSITPSRIGDEWMFSAFVQDITERRQAEASIRGRNAKLEKRIEERTARLQAAVREKERLLEELRSSSLELLARLRELETKSDIISEDLERAQVIQRALLPTEAPRLHGVHVDALYRPGMNVGGDLYDVVNLDEHRVALYVADAAGHGVAAAMLSVLFKQRLEVSGPSGPLSPAQVLRSVNERLLDDGVLSQGMFLTVVYALLDTRTGKLTLASAGHTPALLRRASGEARILPRTGPALGLVEEAVFDEHDLELEGGDRLILYTDGLTDGIEVGAESDLTDLLLPALTGDACDGPYRLRGLFQDATRRSSRVSRGGDHDDVTLLVLDVEAGPSHLDNEPEEAAPASSSAQTAVRPDAGLMIAEGEDLTCLAINGRGSWPHSTTLLELVHEARSKGHRVEIDLSSCTYLDSAFLGTLHEVVTTDSASETSLHDPCEAVCGLFEELGLSRVTAAVAAGSARPPEDLRAVEPAVAGRESHEQLLRAHELLAELSEENRARFSGVLDALRRELGD